MSREVFAAIVGSGFSGLAVGNELKRRDISDFVILERSTTLGGTWRDNHYPGCSCDVPSHLYSFSFAPKNDWSRAFSSHEEIRAYLEGCADRFDLRRHIAFENGVIEMLWDEPKKLWHVKTSAGETYSARAVVLATGGLSNPAYPKFPGAEQFKGKTFHSARWDHNYDLKDKNVAVIGTGASAIQIIPAIQPIVKQLYVLQRTPAWVLPRRDHAFPGWLQKAFAWIPGLRWMYRQLIYWTLESYAIAFKRPRLMRFAAHVGKRMMRKSIADPALRARLTPKYLPGCKRILLSDDYYPAFANSNVELVTDAIESMTEQGLKLASGRSLTLDAIIYGTGFDVHNYQSSMRVIGSSGVNLGELWKEGAHAYLGTTVAGFANMFVMTGPNTGLGHNSMVVMIEGQARYVGQALEFLHAEKFSRCEPKAQIQEEYNAWLDRKGANTVWLSGCASWYLDAQGRNSTIWPGLASTFRTRLARLRLKDFDIE